MLTPSAPRQNSLLSVGRGQLCYGHDEVGLSGVRAISLQVLLRRAERRDWAQPRSDAFLSISSVVSRLGGKLPLTSASADLRLLLQLS